jgi:hypothetical protein
MSPTQESVEVVYAAWQLKASQMLSTLAPNTGPAGFTQVSSSIASRIGGMMQGGITSGSAENER